MKRITVSILKNTLLWLALLPPGIVSAQQSLHQEDCGQIHFRVNQATIDSSYLSNNAQIVQMRQLFTKLLSEQNVTVDSICIASTTSPEGSPSFNTLLAKRRIAFLKRFIMEEFPVIDPSLIRTATAVEQWTSLRELAAADPGLPFREEVLAIVSSTDSDTEKSRRLKALDNGRVYIYIARYMLPPLRSMNRCKVYYRINTIPSDTVADNGLAHTPPIENIAPKDTLPDRHPVEEFMPSPLTLNTDRMFLVKSNLAYLSAAVANIGIEYPLAKHWSLDLPVIYSPYTISRNYKLRLLAFQPEIRYWKDRALKGHYLGMHLHTAWFNVATDSKNRYQDRDGNTPLWGAGLAYGYSLPLKGNWGIDFGIGAGYTRIVYDTFVNEPNGQKYATDTRNYWGITRVGITLTYRINLKTGEQ
ncbi:uncharacterized protein DUF3575 [Dysgonomonas alginatilytica]|uniref:Uncharacterized protein DUF3575 n=1 Tax=Dysgonomonas alginatilytica TaxID=1605892 RepID=A0A2V3PIQ0_9BACT|nr:DUF3575 domain-containing protein [Dysgonomonas alginatilytica]PXV59443.1 uncharacterized protein DUF3575 [Dysgonomonas alginatilytica]